MGIKLIKEAASGLQLTTPKILRLDETLTKEGYAADAAAVGAAIANMPTASPDWFASKGEEGYVDNRPMYPKYTNIPNKLNVETVEPNTAYCLLDGSSYTSIMAEMPSSFDNHSQCYLYYDYTIFGTTSPQKKHLDANTLKVLDSKNYFYKLGGNVVLYVVFDVSLLTDELKAQMPKTGVWLVNGAQSSITTIANVEFHEVTFIKLDKVYLPTDIAYKDYVDAAVSNVDTREKWIELNRITTTEEVSKIVISADSSGNAFECYKIKVLVILPTGLSNSQVWFGNGKGLWDEPVIGDNLQTNDITQYYIDMEVSENNFTNFRFAYNTGSGSFWGDLADGSVIRTGEGMCKNITSFYIQTGEAATIPFPVGTQLIMWGVKV